METTDYSIFRNLTGNRDINQSHVDRLVEAIERKNLLKHFPVLLNEHYEVIDGQHRLAAAAKLNVPIYYAIENGLTLDDVMSVNTNSKSWTINDFIDAYIRLGKEDYIILKRFMERHNITAGISARLLYGTNLRGGTGKLMKQGRFTVNQPIKAERIATELHKLQKYADHSLHRDRTFIETLLSLDVNKDFDFDRLLSKLQMHELMYVI